MNILLLIFFGIIIVSCRGLFFPTLLEISKIAIWFVVVFFFISTILNAVTPSKIERIWAPIAFVQFIATLVIALNC